MSNSPEDERKGRKRHVRTQAKPKNPQKNAREKKWVEAVVKRIRGWQREQKNDNKSGNVTSICLIHLQPDEGAGGAS